MQTVTAEGLTDQEAARLQSVHRQWSTARADRNWGRADRLRDYLERAGCMGHNMERWHPVFEDPKHRRRRLGDRDKAPPGDPS